MVAYEKASGLRQKASDDLSYKTDTTKGEERFFAPWPRGPKCGPKETAAITLQNDSSLLSAPGSSRDLSYRATREPGARDQDLPQSWRAASKTCFSLGTVASSSGGEKGIGTCMAPIRFTGPSRL
jgi:hypothetical protein